MIAWPNVLSTPLPTSHLWQQMEVHGGILAWAAIRVHPRIGTAFFRSLRFFATWRGISQYLDLETHFAPWASSRVRFDLSVDSILMATMDRALVATGVLSTHSSMVVCRIRPSSLSRLLTQTRFSPYRRAKRLAPFWCGA